MESWLTTRNWLITTAAHIVKGNKETRNGWHIMGCQPVDTFIPPPTVYLSILSTPQPSPVSHKSVSQVCMSPEVLHQAICTVYPASSTRILRNVSIPRGEVNIPYVMWPKHAAGGLCAPFIHLLAVLYAPCRPDISHPAPRLHCALNQSH